MVFLQFSIRIIERRPWSILLEDQFVERRTRSTNPRVEPCATVSRVVYDMPVSLVHAEHEGSALRRRKRTDRRGRLAGLGRGAGKFDEGIVVRAANSGEDALEVGKRLGRVHQQSSGYKPDNLPTPFHVRYSF